MVGPRQGLKIPLFFQGRELSRELLPRLKVSGILGKILQVCSFSIVLIKISENRPWSPQKLVGRLMARRWRRSPVVSATVNTPELPPGIGSTRRLALFNFPIIIIKRGLT